jgi:polyisoprenoid-binding protein YceI
VTDLHGSLRVSVQLEAVINRNEYGLEWHADLEGGEAVLGDDVKLIVNLELAQG